MFYQTEVGGLFLMVGVSGLGVHWIPSRGHPESRGLGSADFFFYSGDRQCYVSLCVCVCVCERERGGEKESVCVCVSLMGSSIVRCHVYSSIKSRVFRDVPEDWKP